MSERYDREWESWLEKVEKSGACPPAFTEYGEEVKLLYERRDAGDLEEASRLGFPGQPPYTRGVYPTMYRGRLWTMRQYAGFGTARETNERFKYLLDQGVSGLSVAFDLPTQVGYDSDDLFVEDEVGRVGVAIDTLEDMERTFDGIPLDEVSVNFTINSTAIIILAMYVALAEKQGIDAARLRGTTQNDMIKEFLARKSYIFPVEPSLKLVVDIIDYCHNHLPSFNPISISGYHIREMGADPVQELALTLEAAIVYSERVIARGIDFDSFAPRLSFQFSNTMELFEEVAKYRAARWMWSDIARTRFEAKKDNSGRLRVFAGGTGAGLALQEPLNNIVRGTLQCLAAVLAGAQAVHVPAYDEAYAIPSRESALLSLRTQQILAYETGITKTVDPLGGSYYMEHLTREMEGQALGFMERIEREGGIIRSIQEGFVQREVQRRAFQVEKEKQDGSRVVVGVNRFAGEDSVGHQFELQGYDERVLQDQKDALGRVKKVRDGRAVELSLRRLREAASGGTENLFPWILEAVKRYATVGEIVRVLKDEYGEYREPVFG